MLASNSTSRNLLTRSESACPQIPCMQVFPVVLFIMVKPEMIHNPSAAGWRNIKLWLCNASLPHKLKGMEN